MSKSTILTHRSDMRSALSRIRPQRIAVAYVGADWLGLLDGAPALEEIILSPTLGTNAWAVRQIAAQLGWENVHLLERMHTKLYIGSNAVMVGSANLSANALGEGGSGLFEMVVHTTERDLVLAAESAFSDYREVTRQEYATEKQKRARIDKLEIEAQKAPKTAWTRETWPSVPTFDRYEVGSHPVRMDWWEDTGDEGGEEGDFDSLDILVGENDAVSVGDWVIAWHAQDDGRPQKNPRLCWIRVDEVRRGRHEDPDYIDQIAQKGDSTDNTPSTLPPFLLDEAFKEVFVEVMSDPQHARELWADEAVVPSPSKKKVNDLLSEMQRRYLVRVE